MNVLASYIPADTTFSIDLTADEANLYRARLFLNYAGMLSYIGDEGQGLMVLDEENLNRDTFKSGVLYDDWNCSFRPPRIDAHKFNCELVVPISVGHNDIILEDFGNQVSGESVLESEVTNPVNILIEQINPATLDDVVLIKVDGNNVTVTTEEQHGLTKGDVVTIDNSIYSDKHTLGPDGLRILGSFKVVSVTPTTFTYVTKHYIMPSDTVFIDGDANWKCGKWTAVVYEDTGVTISNKNDDPESGVVVLTYQNPPSYEANDYVNLDSTAQTCQAQVSRVSGTTVEIDNLSVSEPHSIVVYHSPRTPSAAVPTNWFYVDPTTETSYVQQVSNASQYDHTMNTYFVSPYLDTYFTKNDDAVHIGEKTLKCAGGENPSIICIKFPNITMDVDYGQTATLRMYVSKMSYSEATVSLYQMDSSGWREDMSYDEVLEHVTLIPVASAALTNPALKDINRSDDTPNLGDYNSYVDFEIDSVILGQWLSGSTAYPPSVCMKVLSVGDPVIEFNATESGEQVPYFIVTGGEEALLGQEPFDITVVDPATEPGKIIRIEVDDADATFGNSLYDNVVKINGINAVIMNGSPYFIDVVVPDSVAGVSEVQIYKKVRNKELVLTNTTSIYVNNDLTKRDIKLAAKKNPGEISGKTSRSAIYNRDLGYSNFKEVTDETSLLQNVYSCLLTSQGERLFNQNFGSHIEDRIFTLGSTTDEVDLLKECIEVVGKYEPRVQIDPERSSCDFDDNGCYNLVLAVILPTARTEMLKFTFKSRGRIV